MKPGDRINFTPMPDGTVLIRGKNKSVMNLAGSLRRRRRKAFGGRGTVALMLGVGAMYRCAS